jgi:hypothetical protein
MPGSKVARISLNPVTLGLVAFRSSSLKLFIVPPMEVTLIEAGGVRPPGDSLQIKIQPMSARPKLVHLLARRQTGLSGGLTVQLCSYYRLGRNTGTAFAFPERSTGLDSP